MSKKHIVQTKPKDNYNFPAASIEVDSYPLDLHAQAIYAAAAGQWIRDTCHRPSLQAVDLKKIALMAWEAARVFQAHRDELQIDKKV